MKCGNYLQKGRCYTVKCHIWPVSCGDAMVHVHAQFALRPVSIKS